MTSFRCPRKIARLWFIGVGFFGVTINVILATVLGWNIMIRYFSLCIAAPCIIVLLFLSKDRVSQHLFNFFTAINALYLVSVIGRVTQGMKNNIIHDVVIKIVLFSIILYLFHHYWSQPYQFLSANVKKGWGIISILPFLFFALVMFMGLYPTVRTDNLVAVIFLYGILCCVYLVIYLVFRNTYDILMRDSEQQMLTIQLSMQKEYYEAKLGNEQELRRLKHDIQGHFSVTAALLLEDKNQEALEYLDELAMLRKNWQMEVICENPYINAVVSIFADRFQESSIPFEYHIQFEELSIPDPVLCLILNNALQNAQEAVLSLPPADRTVKLQTTIVQRQLIIRVSNRFNGTLQVENDLPTTTKTEIGHGYGLASIRTAVKRLGGDIFFSGENGCFELDITIPDKSSSKQV